VPKSLAPVAGRPFLDWQLDLLGRAGIREVTLCAGHGAGELRRHLRERGEAAPKVDLSEEEEPLGTGGALALAWSRRRPPRALVLNGDSLLGLDLDALLSFHHGKGSALTMALARVDDRRAFGSVELGSDDRVIGFREKEAVEGPGWINGGVYVLEDGWQRETAARREAFSLERDLFPELCGRPELGFYAFRAAGPFIDIGTPESYQRAQRFVPETFGTGGTPTS
jgi:D-glycero-alpha-D-manno-heptose 1-phosphate guanylyltransferase